MQIETGDSRLPERDPDEWIYGYTRKELRKMGPKKTAVAIMRGQENQGRTHAVLADVFYDLSNDEIEKATFYGVDVYMGRIAEEE